MNVQCLEIDEKVLSKTTKNQNISMFCLGFKMVVFQAMVKKSFDAMSLCTVLLYIPRGTRIKLHSASSKRNNFGNSADAPVCIGT